MNTTATARPIVTIDGIRGRIVVGTKIWETDARTARNLVDAAKTIVNTRLIASHHRHDGEVGKASDLDQWEIDFMKRMRSNNCDDVVTALVDAGI